MSQSVTVHGVITQVRQNPHSWFFLDVRDASGKVESGHSKRHAERDDSQRLQARRHQGWSRGHDQGFRAKDVPENGM
jgi:hypothetical protein